MQFWQTAEQVFKLLINIRFIQKGNLMGSVAYRKSHKSISYQIATVMAS